MEVTSLAARFRVAHREAAAVGGLAVKKAVRRLDALYASSVFLARGGRWRSWYKHSQYHNLAEALGEMQSKGISLASVEVDLGANAPRPHTCGQAKKLAHGVQKAARRALTRTMPAAPEARMRPKLARWALPLYPRLRATRATAVTARLRKLAPPRVLAAVLRTWFNGWCTKRRFQGKGNCIFGCAFGEDSVDHYMRCLKLHQHAQVRLRLPLPPLCEDRGKSFMLLDSPSQLSDEHLVLRALLLTAAYRLHCKLRLASPLTNSETRQRALDQAVKEAALGHSGAMTTLDGIWKS
jgi:hypothetical protein